MYIVDKINTHLWLLLHQSKKELISTKHASCLQKKMYLMTGRHFVKSATLKKIFSINSHVKENKNWVNLMKNWSETSHMEGPSNIHESGVGGSW